MRPIFCGNFEYDARQSDLERLFGRYGKVDRADMKSGTVHVVLLASMSYGSRCAACKYLRRKCPPDCSLAPYFPSNNPRRFASVHRIYGASNVVKMLQKIESHDLRVEAANSLHFEAQRRIEDPVYGCAGMISQLHQQIQGAETELAKVQAEIILKRSATISAQEIDHDHHHYGQLLEMESDLNNILLQGQSSVQQSHFGPSTNAPWQ